MTISIEATVNKTEAGWEAIVSQRVGKQTRTEHSTVKPTQTEAVNWATEQGNQLERDFNENSLNGTHALFGCVVINE